MTHVGDAPSRDSNPFATCWTRPGALAFAPTATTSVADCVAKLRASGWRGQILGAHGAGKSALLRALRDAAQREGLRALWLRAAPDARRAESASVVFLDSFEQLSRWRRWQWRRRRGGLVVTSHRTMGLPTLARLRPTLADATALFAVLTAERETPVTLDDLTRSYQRRQGNVRDMWFDLYDRHERLTRNPANQAGRSA